MHSFPFHFLFRVPQAKPEPISVYHPTIEEIFAVMGTPKEGFFDGADMVAETMASVAPVVAQGVPTKTPIPSIELVPVGEGTHTERVSESSLIPAETLTPQKGATPLAAFQTEVASPATPLVISTSDPFTALSHAVNDGSSLVVTPSSIRSSTTRGPDADLSSEGPEEVLKDSNDELTIKKRISDFDEEEGDDHEAEAMGTYLSYLLSFPFTF